MTKATHERKAHMIKNLVTGERKDHETINKAKIASRNIQLSDGGLGAGAVRVVK